MTTATVTRRFQAEGLPVELVRGKGYHYWVWDDGTNFETESEMVFRFRDLTVDAWVARGRDFVAKVQALIADRAEYAADLAAEAAARAARVAKPVEAPFVGYYANHSIGYGWSHYVRLVTCEGVELDGDDFRRKPDALRWLKDKGATAAQVALIARLMKSRDDALVVRADGRFSDNGFEPEAR